jgi:hypothetical protein
VDTGDTRRAEHTRVRIEWEGKRDERLALQIITSLKPEPVQ